MNSYVLHTAADKHNNEQQMQVVIIQKETEKVLNKLIFMKKRGWGFANLSLSENFKALCYTFKGHSIYQRDEQRSWRIQYSLLRYGIPCL